VWRVVHFVEWAERNLLKVVGFTYVAAALLIVTWLMLW
jgi:hypothetical protein